MISLSNAHMRVAVASVCWSPSDAQLVGALLGAVDRVALLAIKAELEKHNGNAAVRLTGEVAANLDGAQRGYITAGAPLERLNAVGQALLLQHWRAGDPRRVLSFSQKKAAKNAEAQKAAEWFYVVALTGEDLLARFGERLQIALPWPLKAAWAESLLTLGLEHHLVERLSVATAAEAQPALADGARLAFQAGLRVLLDEEQWSELLSTALKSGALKF